MDNGGPHCIAFGGLRADDAIEEALLGVVGPGAIAAATAAGGEARREMALDGEDFQAGKLTTLPFHISSKVAPLLGGSRGPNFPKWNSPTRRPHFF